MTTALDIDSVASSFDNFPNLLPDPHFADDASKMMSASALIPKLEVFSASPLATCLTQSTSMAPPSFQPTTITSPATVIQPNNGLAQQGPENDVSSMRGVRLRAYALGGLKRQYYVDRAPRMVIWLENNHLLEDAGKEICVRGYCRHEATGILSESLKPKQILEGKRMVDWTHCFEIVSKDTDTSPLILRAKNKREFVKWTTCLSQKDNVDTWKDMSGYLWTKPAEKRWFFEIKNNKITMAKEPGGKVVREWTDLNATRLVPHEKGIVLNKHNGWQATVTFRFPSTVSNSLIKGWQRIYLTAQPEVADVWSSDSFFVRSSNRHSRDAPGRSKTGNQIDMPVQIFPRPPGHAGGLKGWPNAKSTAPQLRPQLSSLSKMLELAGDAALPTISTMPALTSSATMPTVKAGSAMSLPMARSATSQIGWQCDPLGIAIAPGNPIPPTNTRLLQASMWNPFQSGVPPLPSALDLPGYLPDIFSMGCPLDIPLHQRVRLNMKRKRHLCECGESFNTIEGLHGHITTSHPFRKVEDASLLLLLGHKNDIVDAPLRKQLCIRSM